MIATASAVRGFILDQVSEPLSALNVEPGAVPDDFDLLERGVVDSFGLMELLADVEDRFGVEIDFNALDAEVLTLIGPLSRFVETSLASG